MSQVHVVQIPSRAEVHVFDNREAAEKVRDRYQAAGVEAIVSDEPVLRRTAADHVALIRRIETPGGVTA